MNFPFDSIRSFIDALEEHGELQRIHQEVDWNMEAGAIARRADELQKPAPFFERIKGYPAGYRMFSGSTANMRRLSLAFGMDPDSPRKTIIQEYLKRKGNPIKPVLVSTGPCKENIHLGADVNLFEFPAPMIHAGDGGRYLCAWHINITRDPDSNWVNWGMYRAMIHNRNTLGGLVEPYKHIGAHYLNYKKLNKPMPFAIAIGPDPISAFATTCMVDAGINEVDLAGALMQRPIELVKCETVDLEVPATSEIVIEGVVSLDEKINEGPYGEYTGYRASPREPRPVYTVTAITHRNDPIVTFCCTGVPIEEGHVQYTISSSGEIYEELRRQGLPVVDVCSYAECASMMAVVSTKVTYSNIADRIAHAIWGTHNGNVVPWVIVVEDDIDPHKWEQVWHAMVTKCHPYRGIRRIEHATGTPLLPFSSRHERVYLQGAKVLLDCTWPLDWDPEIAVPPRASFDKIYPLELQERVINKWTEYGYE